MNALYLDIFSGISGDLFLGAMLDLGVDFDQLQSELKKLNLRGYHLHVSRRQKQGIEGVKFDVHLDHDHHHHGAENHRHHHAGDAHHGLGHEHEHHPHSHERAHDHEHLDHDAHAHGRTYADIKAMIETSGLSEWVKQKAVAVFDRVAAAEGKVHGQPKALVHFHEVGAVDSIVDIVGACIALELLGRPRVLAGPVVEGTGWIHCAHGRLPLPAPATLEILAARGIALAQCEESNELVTPTGAAILAEFAESFAPMREVVPARLGYGIGTRDNRTRPNVLRAVGGEFVGSAETTRPVSSAASLDWESDVIATLQTNLDDINAEVLGRFVELALAAGALDVFYTPVQMKKNRPGVLLSVLCESAQADRLTELILRETTAFGVRRFTSERRKLRRESIQVPTAYGDVSVKLGRLNGRIVQAAPEYESCKRVADQAHVPLKQVYEAAARAVKVD